MSPSRIDQASAWTHALALYEHPEIAKACLFLQDNFGCNVNLLLFSHYSDSLGYRFEDTHFIEIQRALSVSDGQLKAHRKKRRTAKTANPENYASLLAQELILEEAQHKLIIDTINAMLTRTQQGVTNTQSLAGSRSLAEYLNLLKLNGQQIKKYCDIINNKD